MNNKNIYIIIAVIVFLIAAGVGGYFIYDGYFKPKPIAVVAIPAAVATTTTAAVLPCSTFSQGNLNTACLKDTWKTTGCTNDIFTTSSDGTTIGDFYLGRLNRDTTVTTVDILKSKLNEIFNAKEATAYLACKGSVPAFRYIKLQLQNEYLHIGSINVVNKSGVNVALNKSVTMSSMYNPGYSGGNVTDGDPKTIAHTKNGPDEWIKVDLGQDYADIAYIEVVNRVDGAQGRIIGSTLELTNNVGNVIISSASTKSIFDTTKDVYKLNLTIV